MSDLTVAQYNAAMEVADTRGLNELNLQKEFNNMSDKDKQAIADSFDSLLDLKLKEDLITIIQQYNVNTYSKLVSGPAAEALKKLGIVVQKTDTRMYTVSRLDSNGNIIKDAEGNLEQFKIKDFNSDSYIQAAEANVNDLLAAAGYDCVSVINGANYSGAQGFSSNVKLGASASTSLSNGNAGKTDYQKLYQQLWQMHEAQLKERRENLLNNNKTYSDEETLLEEEEITQSDFNELVFALIDEHDYSESAAVAKVQEKFGVDYEYRESLFIGI